MAHYAFIDDQNIVCEVIVGNDESIAVDWETYYSAVRGMRCLRTSYNTSRGVHALGGAPFRLNYAGIGYVYREDIDGFVPPCPGDGFVLDESTGSWIEA